MKANVTDPYAYLAIQLQQEPNSYEIVTEIDPFDVAEMLGNIGGFWGKSTVPSDWCVFVLHARAVHHTDRSTISLHCGRLI